MEGVGEGRGGVGKGRGGGFKVGELLQYCTEWEGGGGRNSIEGGKGYSMIQANFA